MAAYRANFGDLLEPGFRKIAFDSYKEIPGVREKVFTTYTMEHDSEKVSEITGFGYPQETAEGGVVHYEDPVQGFDKTYAPKKWTLGFKVSREMVEDDRYNTIKKMPQALGRAFRRWEERDAAQVLNRAFNSSYLGSDSEELCSTSHDRADPTTGGVQSNANSAGIILSETNLETGMLAMRGQLDDKGMRIVARAKLLLVPVELDKEAHEVIDSPYKQGTADNDMNYYKGKFQIIDWDFMDRNATHWFLIDPTLSTLSWYWRWRPRFAQDETMDTDMAIYKMTARWANGWDNWRGVWGSQGDGASYSG